MARFLQQKRYYGKQSEVAAEQLNKDLLLASQLLDRKSPRAKVVDRGSNGSAERMNGPTPLNGMTLPPTGPPRVNGTMYGSLPANPNSNNGNNVNVNTSSNNNNNASNNPENNINTMNLQHVRPSPNSALFQPPKPPMSQINSAAAALYSSMAGHPFHMGDSREGVPEQNEALSLVVAPKKKRHKVTDTRITPKTVCRILAQDGVTGQPQEAATAGGGKVCGLLPSTSRENGTESPPPPPPPPRAYHPPPPPMLPVSLPTSVAIPNPSLQESQVFSPYSPFYPQPPPPPPPHSSAGSPVLDMRDSSPPLPPPPPHPLSHPPSMLHPALLAAAAQHGASPDYGSLRSSSVHNSCPTADTADRNSDNSADLPYDGLGPTISFFGYPDISEFIFILPSYTFTIKFDWSPTKIHKLFCMLSTKITLFRRPH
ncbi:hypothetical protein LSTR_LSTR016581 [Laodelphax striatellus]|uniref:Uncharacterized protein n=1 Tax=Laodelphax striatellus TaxID=195883 RepID=A0A482X0J4_LAOST|nr:hypothetical protein LSTR_LSTR016581 [Laodelphax striatellus]